MGETEDNYIEAEDYTAEALHATLRNLTMMICPQMDTDTDNPTEAPTNNPTDAPSNNPTQTPTYNPTKAPGLAPTTSPEEIAVNAHGYANSMDRTTYIASICGTVVAGFILAEIIKRYFTAPRQRK